MSVRINNCECVFHGMEGKSSPAAWWSSVTGCETKTATGGRVQPPLVHGRRNSQFGGAFINGGAASLRATPF